MSTMRGPGLFLGSQEPYEVSHE